MSETPDWIKQVALDIRAAKDTPEIEAAMLSVAARVERETREADAEAVSVGKGFPLAASWSVLAITDTYQEPKP